jgi:prefoldin subunit 5
MSDLEERVHKLEQLAMTMGSTIQDQQREINRLRQELSDEITSNAIGRLTPWPTMHPQFVPS